MNVELNSAVLGDPCEGTGEGVTLIGTVLFLSFHAVVVYSTMFDDGHTNHVCN